MRKLIGILLFVVCSLAASAQRVHFIYLQTEDGHPFYLKMNSQIYSSSGSGYLILPELVDSTYSFFIGFPSTNGESRFTVPVTGRDRGFLVKTLNSRIALFDMQTLTLLYSKQDQGETVSYERRNDDFSSLLSKAARDTSLLYSVVSKKGAENPAGDQAIAVSAEKAPAVAEKPSPDTVINQPGSAVLPRERNSSGLTESTVGVESAEHDNQLKTGTINSSQAPAESDSFQTGPEEAMPLQEQVFHRSTISRHSESSTSEGFGLVFFDDYGTGVDTVQLIIPNQKLVFRTPAPDTSSAAVQFIEWDDKPADTAAKRGGMAGRTADNKEIDAIEEGRSTDKPKTTENTQKSDSTPKQVMPTPAYKTDCKTVATGRDFFNLRKNMASEETDEGMVDEAKKYFKSKCFSTEQIKNLSALFLTSAGKYQFFDAAYFHVTDPQAFPRLASEIKDDYYLRRFQALIGE